MTSYHITGGDNGAYGPAFGPVLGYYGGRTLDERGERYMLIALDAPLELEGKQYRCLTVTNRYASDDFETVCQQGGTIGIGGTEISNPALLKRPLDFQNEVRYLAVGMLQPVSQSESGREE